MFEPVTSCCSYVSLAQHVLYCLPSGSTEIAEGASHRGRFSPEVVTWCFKGGVRNPHGTNLTEHHETQCDTAVRPTRKRARTWQTVNVYEIAYGIQGER